MEMGDYFDYEINMKCATSLHFVLLLEYWCIVILHLEKQDMICLEQSQFG